RRARGAQQARRGTRPVVFARRCPRVRGCARDCVSGADERSAALRRQPRSGLGRTLESARRSRTDRSAHHRGAGSRGSRACAAACGNQGDARLACPPSLLPQWRRDCPSCKTEHFPRTDPVVIMLAIAGERCVLGRSPRFPKTMWSCLAGFAEPGESIEEAVRREVQEEVGLTCAWVKYFASQPWPFPSSLMIGCHAEALTEKIVIDHSEIEEARWFDREELKLMLTRKHPQGLTAPPAIAIAHHIIRAFVENGGDVLA